MLEDNITTTSGNESHQFQGPQPGFDCTSFIEQVIEQTSTKLANTMAIITSTFKNQQQKMKKVKDILSGISQVFVQLTWVKILPIMG